MTTQDFFTSRRNYNDGTTRIGEEGRLWYDSETNTIRVGDGITPGGRIVSASGTGTTVVGGTFYFQDLASDLPTYEVLTRTPTLVAQDDESTTVSSSSGEVLIDQYITSATELSDIDIPPGDWQIGFWRYVDSPNASSQIRFRGYIRHADTTETEIFSAYSGDINDITATYQELNFTTSSFFTITTGDRLLIRVYALTTSNSDRVVHWVHDNGTASHIHTPIIIIGGGTGSGASGWSGYSGQVGAGGVLGYYGVFIDTGNQTIANIQLANVVSIGTTVEASGVSIVDGSKITFTNTGTYNIQYSFQFANESADVQDVNIWLKKGGNNVSDSNSVFTIPAKHGAIHGHLIAAINYILTVNAGENVQLYWSTSSVDVLIETKVEGTDPIIPATPGVIVTAQQVMYTQSGFSGYSGVGLSGYSGAQGISGWSGYSGIGLSGYSGAPISWTKITGNTNAISRTQYLADTSGGSFWLILPSSPTSGDTVIVSDGSDFIANPLYIDSNGKAIDGVTDNLSLDVRNILVYFVYDGVQWQVAATAGPKGESGYSGYSGPGLTINDVTANTNYYPTFTVQKSDYLANINVTSSKLYWNPGSSELGVNGNLILSNAKGYGVKVDANTPAYPWHDMLGPISIRGTGAADPSYNVYQGGIRGYQFNVGQEVFIEFHIPHDYAPGTDLFIHTHWSLKWTTYLGAATNPATGGSVTWGFEVSYAKGHNQEFFIAPITTSVTQNASTTQFQHMIAETQLSAASPTVSQLDSDLIEVDGLIIVRAYLSSNDVTVTSGQLPSPFLHMVDIHYQSTNIGTKNKAPSFW